MLTSLEKKLIYTLIILPTLLLSNPIYSLITSNPLNTINALNDLVILLIIETFYNIIRKDIKWKSNTFPKKIIKLENLTSKQQTLLIITLLINISLNNTYLKLINQILLITTITPLLIIIQYELRENKKLYQE